MVTTKRCAYGTCKNDSRYPERLVKNSNGDPVRFYHFPGEARQSERRRKWIRACNRGDSFVCTKDSYICSLLFVGSNGPTPQDPDPVSAVASKEKVSRLNRKRKTCNERDADRERRKKVCFEQSVAKTLLNLHRHCGASKDEYEAAEALLTLEQEPVASTGEVDEEGMNEVETEQIVDDFHELFVTSSAQTDEKLLRESSTQTLGKDKLMKMLFMDKVLDPKKTQHYTGMAKECLELIFYQVEDKASRIIMWKGSRKTNGAGRVHNKYLKKRQELAKLTAKEQFVFTLVRLKRNPSLEVLCDEFGSAM